MKIYKEIEQGTPEWHKIRTLKLTASNATAIGNNGAGLKTLVSNLILDHILVQQERYVSKDMERGNDLEPIARSKYEFEYGVEVDQVGFIERDLFTGFSPDGLIEKDYLNEGKGLVEFKARNDAKHLALLRGGPIESGVIWQMNFQMLISERGWCDFGSYNPNFKQSLFVKRFYPDEVKQQKLEVGLEAGIKMIKSALLENAIQLELIK